MQIPQTLTGQIGFIIFVGSIAAFALIDLQPNNPVVNAYNQIGNTEKEVQNVLGGLNQTTNTTPDSSSSLSALTQLINFFLFLFFLPLKILAFLGIITIVLSPASGLPKEFLVLDEILIIMIVLGIYKFIRAHTE